MALLVIRVELNIEAAIMNYSLISHLSKILGSHLQQNSMNAVLPL